MVEQNNTPEFKERSGSLSCGVWENQYGKSVKVQKSFLPKEVREALNGAKAKPEDWKRSDINLFLNELHDLKVVVDATYEKYKVEVEKALKK